ncbi:hypothetical protein RHMOL_Rhmol09G0044700 [Rhododendron molle]|uniref:Uncharacterized protein n=1 Tax=Rhododendron molle TaxID=49168 RepID=A0ACC0MBB3_RHOML|nr:hypothetical protein RHMOL_Rhmol09G0044700 [Rhododendron molle]
MVSVEDVRKAQRVEGSATVMAIGTSTPQNCINQSMYPNYYFQITKSEHKTELKEKFQRVCDISMIKKRYMYLTEEILKENPSVCEHMPGADFQLTKLLSLRPSVKRLMMYFQGCFAGVAAPPASQRFGREQQGCQGSSRVFRDHSRHFPWPQ